MKTLFSYLPTQQNFILSFFFILGLSLFTLNQNFQQFPKISDGEKLIRDFDKNYPITASTKRSGSFFDPLTWGGQLPTSKDNLLIKANHIVTIDRSQTVVINSLKIKGKLQAMDAFEGKQTFRAILNEGEFIVTRTSPSKVPISLVFTSLADHSKQSQTNRKPPLGLFNLGLISISSDSENIDPAQSLETLKLKTALLFESDSEFINFPQATLKISGVDLSNFPDAPEIKKVQLPALSGPETLYQTPSYQDWHKNKSIKEKSLLKILNQPNSGSTIKNSFFRCAQKNCLLLAGSTDLEILNNVFAPTKASGIVLLTGKETNNKIIGNQLVGNDTTDQVGFYYRNPANDVEDNSFSGFGVGLALDLIDNSKEVPPRESIDAFQFKFGKFNENRAERNFIGFFLGSSRPEYPQYQAQENTTFKGIKASSNVIGMELAIDSANFQALDFSQNLVGIKLLGNSNSFIGSKFTANLDETYLGAFDSYAILISGDSNAFDQFLASGFSLNNSSAVSFLRGDQRFIEPDNRFTNVNFQNSREFFFPNRGSFNTLILDNNFASSEELFLTKNCQAQTSWRGSLCLGHPTKFYFTNGSVSQIDLRRLDTNVSISLEQKAFNQQGVFKYVGTENTNYEMASQNNANFGVNYQSEKPAILKFKAESPPSIILNGEIYAPFSDGVENWQFDEVGKTVNLILREAGNYRVQN